MMYFEKIAVEWNLLGTIGGVEFMNSFHWAGIVAMIAFLMGAFYSVLKSLESIPFLSFVPLIFFVLVGASILSISHFSTPPEFYEAAVKASRAKDLNYDSFRLCKNTAPQRAFEIDKNPLRVADISTELEKECSTTYNKNFELIEDFKKKAYAAYVAGESWRLGTLDRELEDGLSNEFAGR